MELLIVFLKGLIVGFAVAVPLGPVAVLCIRRTMHHGMSAGLVSGLGASTVDALYGGVAALGVSAISTLLLTFKIWLQFIGGIFLLSIGIALVSAPQRLGSRRSKYAFGSDYASTFFLALTNPTLIFSFGALFTVFGLLVAYSTLSASLLIGGIFLGSMLWWAILSFMVSKFHWGANALFVRAINLVAGFALILFALVTLGNVIKIFL